MSTIEPSAAGAATARKARYARAGARSGEPALTPIKARIGVENRSSPAVTATPTAAATVSEALVARAIASVNSPGSGPSSEAAAATRDVVADERKLNDLATMLNTAMAIPAPASSAGPKQRPRKAVSTRDAIGSTASPASAGTAILMSERSMCRTCTAFCPSMTDAVRRPGCLAIAGRGRADIVRIGCTVIVGSDRDGTAENRAADETTSRAERRGRRIVQSKPGFGDASSRNR